MICEEILINFIVFVIHQSIYRDINFAYLLYSKVEIRKILSLGLFFRILKMENFATQILLYLIIPSIYELDLNADS